MLIEEVSFIVIVEPDTLVVAEDSENDDVDIPIVLTPIKDNALPFTLVVGAVS